LSLFIATTPRSGSWLLAEGLRSLDIVGHPEEFFSLDVEPLYRRQWGLPVSGSYVEYVRHVLREGCTSNGVFAVKVHWFQFAHLLRRLRTLNGNTSVSDRGLLEQHFGPFEMVHLERVDTLRQAISWHRALCTDQWWSVPGTVRRREEASVEFDFESVKHLYYLLGEYKASWRAWFGNNGIQPLELNYEGLVEDYPTTLRSVVGHMTLAATTPILSPLLQRQADARTEAWARAYRHSWTSLFGSQGT
jgi:LPS sulfotransferase NodH